VRAQGLNYSLLRCGRSKIYSPSCHNITEAGTGCCMQNFNCHVCDLRYYHCQRAKALISCDVTCKVNSIEQGPKDTYAANYKIRFFKNFGSTR
jgi:hypothetical protein